MFLSKPIKAERRKDRTLHISPWIWCLIFITFNLISFRSQAFTQYLFSWLGLVFANISLWLLETLQEEFKAHIVSCLLWPRGDTFVMDSFLSLSEFWALSSPVLYLLFDSSPSSLIHDRIIYSLHHVFIAQVFVVIYTEPYAFCHPFPSCGSVKLPGQLLAWKSVKDESSIVLCLLFLNKIQFSILHVLCFFNFARLYTYTYVLLFPQTQVLNANNELTPTFRCSVLVLSQSNNT